MEDKFNKIFNEELKEMDNINNRIYKEIAKKIITILFTIIMSFCLVIMAVKCGLDTYYTNTRYNPFKEEGAKELYKNLFVDGVDIEFDELDGKNDNGKNYYYASYNEYLMSTFVSTFFPGYTYEGHESIEDLGYGRYKVYGTFGKMGLDVNPTIISDSYVIDENYSSLGAYSGYSNTFSQWYKYKGEISKSSYVTETLIPEVEKLPESTLFEVYVTYINPILLDVWNKENVPVYDYRYVLTRFGEDQLRDMGFRLKDTSGGWYMDRVQDTYPISYANDAGGSGSYLEFAYNTSDDFYEYYKMKLTILSEHKEFVTVLEQGLNEITNNVNIELKNIEERNVEVKGFMAHVNKKEFLEILRDENTYNAIVKDVKYSIFE